ncbi:MAG: hypothetical protein IT364_17935 [Candidatus Hydrogenedentes bacterium]|nr:hypothetical protein [Candidatus Hydrogenedentota bacterium]
MPKPAGFIRVLAAHHPRHRRGIVTSEAVVSYALRNTLPHLLADSSPGPNLAKLIQ